MRTVCSSKIGASNSSAAYRSNPAAYFVPRLGIFASGCSFLILIFMIFLFCKKFKNVD